MIRTFSNFGDLTADMAFDLIERLAGIAAISASFGASNQSCSRYVSCDLIDDEGDLIDEGGFKVRFSDHRDSYGSDITIRIDELVEVVEDEGQYVETTIEDWRYQDALESAEAAVRAHVAAVMA